MRGVLQYVCRSCPPQRDSMSSARYSPLEVSRDLFRPITVGMMTIEREMMRRSFTTLAFGFFLAFLLVGSAYSQPTKFVITGSGTQTAGTSQNLTIRADSLGLPAASYDGLKTLIFSGADPSLSPAVNPTVTNVVGTAVDFGSATAIQFTNGLATVSGSSNGQMTLYRVIDQYHKMDVLP